MPKRFISSDFWNDAIIETLSFKAKFLFLYLITSPHSSQAGIGQATNRKIANETDLPLDEIESLFEELKPVVERQNEWFWVKNFLKHQGQNKNFCISALKYAERTPFFNEFVAKCSDLLNKYNIKQIRSEQEVSKPYANGIDTVSEQYQNSNDTLSKPLAESLKPVFYQTESIPGVSVNPEVILCWSEKLSIIQFSELEKMAIHELYKLGCTPDDAFQARLENPKYFGRLDGEHTKRLIITHKDIRQAKKASGHGLPCAF